jgi:hypothetical protein
MKKAKNSEIQRLVKKSKAAKAALERLVVLVKRMVLITVAMTDIFPY